MAAFKWIVLLLACNLIGLFDDRSVTAAPVYDSKESQNSEAIDSTSEDMKDDVISSTHEEDTHSEGTSGDETAEKGDENVSNMEGDEAGSGRELGDTDEYSEISSNTHANDDAGKAQNVSDEEEGGNEEKSSIENEDKSLDGTLPEEGDETNEEKSSKENEDKSMDGTLQEEGDETNEENSSKENEDKSMDGTVPEEGDETNEENSSKENEDKSMGGTLQEEGDETNEENSSKENEGKSMDGTLPEEGDETNEENSSKENEDKSMDGTLPEEGDETNEKNTPTETQHNDDLSLPVNDDKTGLDGNVESDREADSSNSELNQGSSASSEQGNDDEYQMSSVPTEAPDSEMLGGNYDDSNLPFSESKVAPLKEEQGDDDDGDDDDNNDDNDSDGGTVAEDHGDNVSDSDGPAGDQSETDAEHAAELHENTEKDNTEVNKDDNDDDESEIDSGTEAPDDTHGALVSSSEDGTEDQNNNMEGNNSGVAESSPQGMKEEEDDDDDDDDVDISEEGDSGTDTRDDISDTSSEVGTDDQNPSVEGSSQVGGSIIEPHAEISAKHFLQAARAFKPLPVPSSDSITSNNETEKKDDPATTDISQKADNESNIAANITGNLGEDEDRQSETSVENAVTTSVPGFENNTLHGSRVQKVALDDDGINEPGLGSQKRDSVSSSSIGSYVVLGVIMAVIVVLLGYSVLKGRSKHAQGAKNEDFGTEMSDVKKNLLPRNEIKGEIQPNTRPEGDESNAKLLPDAQCTGNNVQNGEAGVADQNDVDSQKELGEIDDAPTEKKINFVRPEIQSEPTDSPEDTLNSQNQNRNNPFKGAVTPKKEETADGQSTHHRSLNTSSHQNTYNNVNGVPEAVFKKEPGQMHSRSVTQNSNVPVIIHRGFQQQPMHTVYSSAPQPTVIQTYPVEKVTVETKIITY